MSDDPARSVSAAGSPGRIEEAWMQDGNGPPGYEEARNRRQKVRAAGLDPAYWYPVEYDRAIKPGEVREVVFWGRSYALFRGMDGSLRAVENRCAHRQLQLTVGKVQGCNLVCSYHGWEYDGDGRVVNIPHELFGRPMPRIRIGSSPVQVRYGLIWMFFGDEERAQEHPLPRIPELEGPLPWPCVPIDFVWKAHHSMIIDNVSDFTHEYLHRKYRPFSDAQLTECRTEGDKIFVTYKAKIGRGPFYRRLVNHQATNTDEMRLCYEYPFQWSNTDDRIKHHCFVLPIDRTTTRAFFLFYYDHRAFKLPFLPIRMPRRLMIPILHIANRMLIRPLLDQDGFAVQEEQKGYDQHFDAPLVELNPAVHAFQALTLRKWDEYLGRAEQRKARNETGSPTPFPIPS
jgi:phenylpropionate dioxygenase-like ring-hydroxylating dioxygenase large terminal subunit